MTQKSVSELRIKILSAFPIPLGLSCWNILQVASDASARFIPAFRRSQSTISKHLNILYEVGIRGPRQTARGQFTE